MLAEVAGILWKVEMLIKVTPNLRGATLVDFFFCQENESSSVKVSFPEKSKQKY